VVLKRLDWGILAALAAGTSAILLWLPLLQGVRSNVAGNAATQGYFATPTVSALLDTYELLFSSLLLPALICAVMVLFVRKGAGEANGVAAQPGIPAHDAMVAACLVLYPIVCFLVAFFVTKTFAPRYVLTGAMGVAIAVGFLAYRFVGRRGALGTAVLMLLYVNFTSQVLPFQLSGRPYAAQYSFLGERTPALPIVVTEGQEFAPLWYYASAALRSRLYYITDLPFARRTTDTTNEIIMEKLRPMAPQSIVGFDKFVKSHPAFLLYYRGGSANSSLNELLLRKCVVTLESKRGQQLLFRCGCG
jgi:hypothetical protein